MLTIEEVIKKLEQMNLTYVAKETNLPYCTVWKIVNKKLARTPYDAIKKLSDYLEALYESPRLL